MTTKSLGGRVYILRDPYHKDALIKIGRTKMDPEERARELSRATGVPHGFEVMFEEDVSDCTLAETLVHQKLSKYRINPRREFFRLPLKNAIRVVFTVCIEMNKEPAGGLEQRLVLYVTEAALKQKVLEKLRSMINRAHGGGNVVVHIFIGFEDGPGVQLRLADGFKVIVTPALLQNIKKLPGVEDLDLIVREQPRRSGHSIAF